MGARERHNLREISVRDVMKTTLLSMMRHARLDSRSMVITILRARGWKQRDIRALRPGYFGTRGNVSRVERVAMSSLRNATRLVEYGHAKPQLYDEQHAAVMLRGTRPLDFATNLANYSNNETGNHSKRSRSSR